MPCLVAENHKIFKKVSFFPAVSQQPNTHIIINKDGVLENRKRNSEGDPPGHIGLISENHPGITAEIQSGCSLFPSSSIDTVEAEDTPFSSSSSLGLFTGKSLDTITHSSAIPSSFSLSHTVSDEWLREIRKPHNLLVSLLLPSLYIKRKNEIKIRKNPLKKDAFVLFVTMCVYVTVWIIAFPFPKRTKKYIIIIFYNQKKGFLMCVCNIII